MRKANQTNQEAEIVIERNALTEATAHLDLDAKKRRKVMSEMISARRVMRDTKVQITKLTQEIARLQTIATLKESELEKLPDGTLSEEKVKGQIEAIGKLPWVQKVTLHDSGHLSIIVREGALKTVFYNRIVYKNGMRCEELLPAPITLPMPQYEIRIELANMGGGWDSNSSLVVRLVDPESFKFMPDAEALGWTQVAFPHWGIHCPPWQITRNKNSESPWGTLCLRDYRSNLTATSREGIIDLLNEIAIYLQNAGWAHAYRPKLNWAAQLGYHPYVNELTRPLLDNETFASIQADTRKRMPVFLKENGLTQHMVTYGAPANGDGYEPDFGAAIEQLDRIRELDWISGEEQQEP